MKYFFFILLVVFSSCFKSKKGKYNPEDFPTKEMILDSAVHMFLDSCKYHMDSPFTYSISKYSGLKIDTGGSCQSSCSVSRFGCDCKDFHINVRIDPQMSVEDVLETCVHELSHMCLRTQTDVKTRCITILSLNELCWEEELSVQAMAYHISSGDDLEKGALAKSEKWLKIAKVGYPRDSSVNYEHLMDYLYALDESFKTRSIKQLFHKTKKHFKHYYDPKSVNALPFVYNWFRSNL
jgi:hypothetical protein